MNVKADGTFGDEDEVTIGTTYYFDPAFSLGTGYNIVDKEEDDVYFSLFVLNVSSILTLQ